jgi:hypothetical protein
MENMVTTEQIAHSRPYFSLRKSLTLEYKNLVKDCIRERSRPLMTDALVALMLLSQNIQRRSLGKIKQGGLLLELLL